MKPLYFNHTTFLSAAELAKLGLPSLPKTPKGIAEKAKIEKWTTRKRNVQTVASWLLFSGQQVHDLNDLLQCGWYARVRLTQYDVAGDYLTDLEIVSESYADLIPKFINQDKVLLLLDPPYICTEQGAYLNETYFRHGRIFTFDEICSSTFYLFQFNKE